MITRRDTKQRQAIALAIDTLGRAVSPVEIQNLAQESVPQLGIATIYRNIKAMVEAGELVPVEIPGMAPRYQRPTRRKQHLMVDESRNEVHTVEIALDGFQPNVPGFVVERFQIMCFGHSVGPNKGA
jgi:Fur family ferric uptake transcriptional regulator